MKIVQYSAETATHTSTTDLRAGELTYMPCVDVDIAFIQDYVDVDIAFIHDYVDVDIAFIQDISLITNNRNKLTL